MHEMSLLRGLLARIEEIAGRSGGNRVVTVRLKLGRWPASSPSISASIFWRPHAARAPKEHAWKSKPPRSCTT
jgi:hypothetical protein